MSDNSFTEVTNQSWFSRIGGALKGILIGMLLFIISFPIIIWNEKRAVDTSVGLKEAEGIVVSVAASPVSPENNGKLIHFTANANTDDVLEDDEFGFSVSALKLTRTVEMYQWEEESESKTEKKLGGSTETVTTYNYREVWSNTLIDSSQFKQSSDYVNPGSMQYLGRQFIATNVQAGDYLLPQLLVEKLQNYELMDLKGLEGFPDNFVIQGRQLVSGDPLRPEIGDYRISFAAVPPGPVSVVAQQVEQSLEEFHTGTGTTVAVIESGTFSAANLFKKEQEANSQMTWIIRLVALILMGLGIGLFLNPLKVLADVVPFLGSVVGMGTGIVAALLALALTSVTIAITWIAVRPLLGIILLIVAGGAFYSLKTLAKKNAPVEEPEAEAS